MPDFFGNGGQLYELASMSMDKNTTSEQLRDLIETLGVWGRSHQKLTIKQENDTIFMLKSYPFLEGKAKHLTIL